MLSWGIGDVLVGDRFGGVKLEINKVELMGYQNFLTFKVETSQRGGIKEYQKV